jgi:hypothetical protein
MYVDYSRIFLSLSKCRETCYEMCGLALSEGIVVTLFGVSNDKPLSDALPLQSIDLRTTLNEPTEVDSHDVSLVPSATRTVALETRKPRRVREPV